MEKEQLDFVSQQTGLSASELFRNWLAGEFLSVQRRQAAALAPPQEPLRSILSEQHKVRLAAFKGRGQPEEKHLQAAIRLKQARNTLS